MDEFRARTVEDFLFTKTFNNLPPGFGKTYLMKQIIIYCLIHNLKCVFVFPSHLKIREFISEWDGVFNHIILRGKLQHGMCNLNDPKEAYYPGCDTFECNKCDYKEQFKELYTENIVFMVPNHLIFLEDIEPDVLIIDESIEQFVYSTIRVPPRLRRIVHHNPINCENCPIKDKCSPRQKAYYNDKKYGEHRHCLYEVYHEVDVERFQVESLEEHFFKFALTVFDKIYSIRVDGEYKITGEFDLSFIWDIPNLRTLIYNDATGRLDTAQRVFHTKFDVMIQSKQELNNEVVMLDEMITINKTRKLLNGLEADFQFWDIPTTKDTLIYCKKMFEGDIKKLFPDVEIDHYGNSRGFNMYEHCSNVVLVGRYGFRTSHQSLLMLRGETTESVEWMEKAEEIQAFNRARPYLDDSVRIFLFTNSLKTEIDSDISYTRAQKRIAIKILGNKRLEGLNKTEIYSKVKGKTSNIKKALEILYYQKKINDMNLKDSKLQFEE